MAAKPPLEDRLAKRVRAVRKAKGLSQMDLVRRFDWTLSHYQKIERGDLDPRLSTIEKIADCFGVSLSVLLRGI